MPASAARSASTQSLRTTGSPEATILRCDARTRPTRGRTRSGPGVASVPSAVTTGDVTLGRLERSRVWRNCARTPEPAALPTRCTGTRPRTSSTQKCARTGKASSSPLLGSACALTATSTDFVRVPGNAVEENSATVSTARLSETERQKLSSRSRESTPAGRRASSSPSGRRRESATATEAEAGVRLNLDPSYSVASECPPRYEKGGFRRIRSRSASAERQRLLALRDLSEKMSTRPRSQSGFRMRVRRSCWLSISSPIARMLGQRSTAALSREPSPTAGSRTEFGDTVAARTTASASAAGV